VLLSVPWWEPGGPSSGWCACRYRRGRCLRSKSRLADSSASPGVRVRCKLNVRVWPRCCVRLTGRAGARFRAGQTSQAHSAVYIRSHANAVTSLLLHTSLSTAWTSTESMLDVSDGPTEAAPLASAPGELVLTLGSCRYDAELSAAAAARKLDALRVYGASEESAGRLKARVLHRVMPPRMSTLLRIVLADFINSERVCDSCCTVTSITCAQAQEAATSCAVAALVMDGMHTGLVMHAAATSFAVSGPACQCAAYCCLSACLASVGGFGLDLSAANY
jgi:hypothetical protein